MNTLLKEFENIKKDLIAAYDQKGMRASGDWANSLEVVQDNPFNVKLIGLDYSQQLETGRGAGGMPPVSAIEQWIKDKNIFAQVERNISITSLAFAIAKKIQREGWDREGYGGVDLISDVVTPKRIQDIIDKVGAELAVTHSELFIENIKESFAV
jgi:hypothetical protein